MSDERAITIASSLMPVVSSDLMLARYQTIVEIKDKVMRAGIHYGIIPNTDKPTLLKPGAETLCTAFRLWPDFEALDEPDLARVFENSPVGVPFFMYRYRCTLRTQDGLSVAGTGIGSCNSWEKKYRYRKQERSCPTCGQIAVIKGKADYGGGWLCWKKNGGCGAKFADGDPAIEEQATGVIENPDIAEVINTIDKIAQKRSLIAGVLVAVGASNFFTQDIEDLPESSRAVEGVVLEDAGPPPAPAPTPAPGIVGIGDLLGQYVDDLNGEQVYRLKKYSLNLSGCKHEKHWNNRMKNYYETTDLRLVENVTVEEFVDQMNHPSSKEAAEK